MAQAAAAASNVTPLGRKESQGQEKVIEMDALRQSLPELIQLYGSAQEAKAKLSDAVKAVAEKSGLLSSTVKRVVKAKANQTWEEAKRNAQQLSLVFEEIE